MTMKDRTTTQQQQPCDDLHHHLGVVAAVASVDVAEVETGVLVAHVVDPQRRYERVRGTVGVLR